MRVRVDIADLQLAALPSLEGRPLVAISKHLCGPATGGVLLATGGVLLATGGVLLATGGVLLATGGVLLATGGVLLATGAPGGMWVLSMACGCSPWHVGALHGMWVLSMACGVMACDVQHGVPWDQPFGVHRLGPQEPSQQGQQGQQGQPSQERQQGTRLAGLAIATCCHHLCDWDSYVNPAFFTRLGFAPSDFAAVAWMSSWALLGEGKGATGGGEGATGGGEGATGGGEGATGGGEGATGGGEGATGGGEGMNGESMGGGEEGQDAGEEAGGAAAASGAVPSIAAAAAAKRNGTVVGKEGVEEDQPQEAAAAAAAAAAAQAAATTEAASRPWFAHLSVEHKVQVGRACKMLIDAGRLEWLQGRGLGVEYVEYTTVDVSPENRMLLAVGSQENHKDAFGNRLQ
ncbi:unnamed protein product [Closterium sp. NIES-64]|nr:unnamed protein product [Closterium sp. NIES-64]